MTKSRTKTDLKKQLHGFLAKYDPEIGRIARKCREKLRKRLVGAIELVYDNYNALVFGFGPTDRASDAIFSIALYPRYVSMFFLQGAGLPDPTKCLEGSGNVVRHIRLGSAEMLDEPEIVSLMNTAVHRASVPLDPKQPGQFIVKSISAKQPPRRPQ